jgi:hypothetical protein
MKTIVDRIKDKFAYDVSSLPAYINEQSEELNAELLYSSGLTSRVTVLEGVKGKYTLKKLATDLKVQDASGCGWVDDGDITLTGKDLEVTRLKAQASFCNQDLNQTWAEIMNSLGANAQDRTLPFEDIITAHLVKQTKKKNQDLLFNGDTASLNPELAHFDGLVKLLDADASVIDAGIAGAITSANGYTTAKAIADLVPGEVLDNGLQVEIATGRTEAQNVLNQVYTDKDYLGLVDRTDENGELSFILPNTSIRVRSYPQLNGLDKMYAIPYKYVYYGTDLEDDLSGFSVIYNETDEKLRISNKWVSGITYLFPEYFVRKD